MVSRKKTSAAGPRSRSKGAFAVLGQRQGTSSDLLSRAKSTRNTLSVSEIRAGAPVKALDELAETLRVERARLAEVIGTSVRTLQRKHGDKNRLGAAASDRLARVQRILALAEHVLGETAKATKWLTSPSRVLADVPLYMLDTDIGTQRVQQELRQIEFGMPV